MIGVIGVGVMIYKNSRHNSKALLKDISGTPPWFNPSGLIPKPGPNSKAPLKIEDIKINFLNDTN